MKNKCECVLDAVEAIKDAQDAVEECRTSCFNNLLAPTGVEGDTIPFVLSNSDGSPFHAFGDVGNSENCFVSIWFRVEEIRGCCATLQVLKPFKDTDKPLAVDDIVGEDKCCISLIGACKLEHLEKTNNCIEVDLSCFCSIQCLSPALVRT
jgi:spore coat protein Z